MSGRIDWETVRARLDRNREAMERAMTAGPERIAEVYRRRAAGLARLPARQAAGGERTLLLFSSGGGRYGLELARVREILAGPRCAPVPGGPPELAGVLQVRGEIRPVWDLARLLGHADASGGGFVLLLRNGAREFGLRVGRVEGLRTVTAAELAPAGPDFASGRWITSDLVTILDPDKLIKEDSK